jgi:hypothetical protein
MAGETAPSPAPRDRERRRQYDETLLLARSPQPDRCQRRQRATVQLFTEEYPPFSYREGNTMKGASVEQVEMMMHAAGIDYTIEIMPWTRAYAAQTTPMTCVFTTAHNDERDRCSNGSSRCWSTTTS